MNTAIIAGSQGLAFAVPSNTMAFVVSQIMQFGHVKRGYVGVYGGVRPVHRSMQHRYGLKTPTVVQVAGLDPQGPASRANILPGDLLVAADGQPIGSMDDLYRVVSSLKPSTPLRVQVLRDAGSAGLKSLEVMVQLEDDSKRQLSGGMRQIRLPIPEHLRQAAYTDFQVW